MLILINLNLRFRNKIKATEPFAGVPELVGQKSNRNSLIKINENQLELDAVLHDLEQNEIWLIFPEEKLITRFYRPDSNSNTILLTERCDQQCIMCSQPPKSKDYLYFDLYRDALKLVSTPNVFGISGGEPTLYLEELLEFVRDVSQFNSNIKFHILSNAQHFTSDSVKLLKELREVILWAVPIYGSTPEIHDYIVQKEGAFGTLIGNLNFLFDAGARLEIRTVVLQQNLANFIHLSKLIGQHFRWIEFWSIMQIERFGFARKNYEKKFVDTSIDFVPISGAISLCQALNVPVYLYNFPLCTVPNDFKELSINSISDWKKKYMPICELCTIRENCTGFFEWYREEDGFKNLRPTLI